MPHRKKGQSKALIGNVGDENAIPVEDLVRERLMQIVQDPELRLIGGGKALQINVQLVGDSAIKEAIYKRETVREALRFVLEALPQPKLKWLRLLAKSVAREGRTVEEASEFLGCMSRSLYGNENYNTRRLPWEV